MKKKSIIISDRDHKILVKLSEQFGVNYGTIIGQFLSYFKKTGINPNDPLNENPSLLVKNLDKRIVSFLKVQERDILKPIRAENFEYYEQQKKLIIEFSKWVQEAIKHIDKNDKIRTRKVNDSLNKQDAKFKALEQGILELGKLIDEKNKSGIQGKLKSIFNAD